LSQDNNIDVLYNRFLDRAPDGTVYIAMCFICRSIEANGAAMMITAAFSIMAATFPHDVGKAIVGYFLSRIMYTDACLAQTTDYSVK